ncbi:hypothetical protein GGS20DRAFT_558719 [Poronia punctata]|nr:hypothetical protein GGS20DRAFT_558719 [Poronia punctata]
MSEDRLEFYGLLACLLASSSADAVEENLHCNPPVIPSPLSLSLSLFLFTCQLVLPDVRMYLSPSTYVPLFTSFSCLWKYLSILYWSCRYPCIILATATAPLYHHSSLT